MYLVQSKSPAEMWDQSHSENWGLRANVWRGRGAGAPRDPQAHFRQGAPLPLVQSKTLFKRGD